MKGCDEEENCHCLCFSDIIVYVFALLNILKVIISNMMINYLQYLVFQMLMAHTVWKFMICRFMSVHIAYISVITPWSVLVFELVLVSLVCCAFKGPAISPPFT